MRAVARQRCGACVDDQLGHESFCLNSGRIGGARRGRAARLRRAALRVMSRCVAEASGVRTLAHKQAKALPSSRHKASTHISLQQNDECHSSRRQTPSLRLAIAY